VTILNRAKSPAVALETTLILHGVPRPQAAPLLQRLSDAVKQGGSHPAAVGVFNGVPTVGLVDSELQEMLAAPMVPKVNSSNLGLMIHHKSHAATTVSTTMELAAAAGVRVFATGGIGGVHRNFASHLDISTDLLALTRFPVAVIASGVKSLLDVAATREALETLGIPVVGWQTSRFPAFYLPELAGVGDVDGRFDDLTRLAEFVGSEMARTGRAVLICNPVPPEAAIEVGQFNGWLAEAEKRADSLGATARDRTPRILQSLHEVSRGATLRCNLELAVSNARLAGQLAAAMHVR
jgi:pseudouridine-5'-phosphate glycosidase